jgi:hypothetical protein
MELPNGVRAVGKSVASPCDQRNRLITKLTKDRSRTSFLIDGMVDASSEHLECAHVV